MLIGMPSNILRLLAFLLLQSCMLQLAASQSSGNFTDQSALIAFKSKLSGPNETALAGNWSATANFCDWIGVSCSRRRRRVTGFNLSFLGLQGTISPHIGNLSFLVYLDLSNNSFIGSLPHEISRLHRLRILRLSFNQLEGSIPPTLQNCRNLREIHLSNNRLTGAIPSIFDNMSSLEVMNLEFNGLIGPFPLVIFNISSITNIGIRENQISGTLPTDLCRHCRNLQELFLPNNEFSGNLPSQTNSSCRELLVLVLSYNKFDGRIPEGFGSLEKLQVLHLGGNGLIGNIPPSIFSNLSSLRRLAIQENSIEGSIPSDLSRLPNLSFLNFEMNLLTGELPQDIFNMSSLQTVSFQNNSISGNLPADVGFSCSNLETLIIGGNKISGRIPSSLSNCSKLTRIDFGTNLLSGPIPKSLGSLKYLQWLLMPHNQLTGEPGDQQSNFLSSLSNCRFLEVLSINFNPLDIIIPDSIANFSLSLRMIFAFGSQIKGNIPMGIGSLKGLAALYLGQNNLTGKIPSTIGRLEKLQILLLDDNKIEGFIPEDLCQLGNLGRLFLSNNKISGSIPNCIGNLNRLELLNLSFNGLNSSIPLNLWSIKSLRELDLSSNSLSGYLSPNMAASDVIEYVDLSRNQITGNIPSIIGAFESLRYLDLSKNSFQGNIPKSFGELKGLDALNLSSNNLSGSIPKSLEELLQLNYLNLSFNKLSGEIPANGSFANFTAKSFVGNKALCGNPIFEVPPCPSPSSQRSRVKQLVLKYIVPTMASFIILMIALVYIMLRKHRRPNAEIPTSISTTPTVENRMISYQELCRGTNNFCESNLLGTGGFASVYKGILSNGTIVAVKVLNLQLEVASKSFDAECEALRMIRHRNLVKVITTCSLPNLEFRALVMQYMPNGSLERWLYSHNYCLNLLQRVNIMVDVASALDYLHYGQSQSVVHCDLKPANILLDEDMVAHVGDFGVAKILVENKDATQTKTLGTIGYIAPEYGSEGKVSIKGDVYSYGIILLEMITRKKPTDDVFAEELNLRQWISKSIPNSLMNIVDEGLLMIEEDGRVPLIDVQSILLSIVEIGLKCSEALPDERFTIKDVLPKLIKIQLTLIEKGKHSNLVYGLSS
ncbi:probable LRR receptor-like serine/threonine-protein kinase At3g47570 [Alnus glutinosa]|uniref:probable LRR receptor-like serine/threonine-protein kinase At3g47570 n=1 Tax=Alnus glutinosa TaxID=3517 RepID=UPI002D78ADE2|nr:probable LRR receptor-like serine/threonine-protein kinase At3g47570 [Alnus glutinosa]